MRSHSFQIGDRVKAASDAFIAQGETGTIVGFYNMNNDVLHVEWDKYSHARHSCSGLCKEGYGWNVWFYSVTLIEDETNISLDVATMEVLL